MAADILESSSFSSTSPSLEESVSGRLPENVGVFKIDWKKKYLPINTIDFANLNNWAPYSSTPPPPNKQKTNKYRPKHDAHSSLS